MTTIIGNPIDAFTYATPHDGWCGHDGDEDHLPQHQGAARCGGAGDVVNNISRQVFRHALNL
ncbi:MAG: hypothetical protein ACXVKP_14075, partial [Ilumatobacteraceae bacterium]